MVDDLIDTAGTLVKGAEALIDRARQACRHARHMRSFQDRR